MSSRCIVRGAPSSRTIEGCAGLMARLASCRARQFGAHALKEASARRHHHAVNPLAGTADTRSREEQAGTEMLSVICAGTGLCGIVVASRKGDRARRSGGRKKKKMVDLGRDLLQSVERRPARWPRRWRDRLTMTNEYLEDYPRRRRSTHLGLRARRPASFRYCSTVAEARRASIGRCQLLRRRSVHHTIKLAQQRARRSIVCASDDGRRAASWCSEEVSGGGGGSTIARRLPRVRGGGAGGRHGRLRYLDAARASRQAAVPTTFSLCSILGTTG